MASKSGKKGRNAVSSEVSESSMSFSASVASSVVEEKTTVVEQRTEVETTFDSINQKHTFCLDFIINVQHKHQ